MKRKNSFIETSLKIFKHWSLHKKKDSPGFRERYPSPKNVHILDGGVDSSCQDRFKGFLCASCSINHYLRFNTCLECSRMVNTIISCVVVVLVFVAVFLVVLWGDSKRTENNRTVADVVMSCCKIVIGFYQVIAERFCMFDGLLF